MNSKKHSVSCIDYRNKPFECTFIENENADDLTKDIIKNAFSSMELLSLSNYYGNLMYDKVERLCEKLNEKYPQAVFDMECGAFVDFTIIATIKPYKNLTEKRIKKICEMTNTTTEYDGKGETVYFYFDKENFFDNKYNDSSFELIKEFALKYNLGGLLE